MGKYQHPCSNCREKLAEATCGFIAKGNQPQVYKQPSRKACSGGHSTCEPQFTSLQVTSGSPRAQFKGSLSQAQLAQPHSSALALLSRPLPGRSSEPTWHRTLPATQVGSQSQGNTRGKQENISFHCFSALFTYSCYCYFKKYPSLGLCSRSGESLRSRSFLFLLLLTSQTLCDHKVPLPPIPGQWVSPNRDQSCPCGIILWSSGVILLAVDAKCRKAYNA